MASRPHQSVCAASVTPAESGAPPTRTTVLASRRPTGARRVSHWPPLTAAVVHIPHPAKLAPHPRRCGNSDGSNASWSGGRDGGGSRGGGGRGGGGRGGGRGGRRRGRDADDSSSDDRDKKLKRAMLRCPRAPAGRSVTSRAVRCQRRTSQCRGRDGWCGASRPELPQQLSIVRRAGGRASAASAPGQAPQSGRRGSHS